MTRGRPPRCRPRPWQPIPRQTRWSASYAHLTPTHFARPRRCWTRWMRSAWLPSLRPSEHRSCASRRTDIWPAVCCWRPSGFIGSAASADPTAAEAYVGLARVRQRSGDLEGARTQAEAALRIAPSADAYLLLAELDLGANHLKQAEDEAGSALKLQPANHEAQESSAPDSGPRRPGEIARSLSLFPQWRYAWLAD